MMHPAAAKVGHSSRALESRHSAVMVGFSNTIGQIRGILGVAVTGWLGDSTGTYAAAFVLGAAVSALAALAFGFLFDAHPLLDQPPHASTCRANSGQVRIFGYGALFRKVPIRA